MTSSLVLAQKFWASEWLAECGRHRHRLTAVCALLAPRILLDQDINELQTQVRALQDKQEQRETVNSQQQEALRKQLGRETVKCEEVRKKQPRSLVSCSHRLG